MTSLLRVARSLVKRRVKDTRLLEQADLARDAKEYAKAAFLYEQYLADDPRNAAIQIQCGHMYKECGFLEQAGKHYAAALSLTPKDPDLQLQMGHFHRVSGNPDMAIAAYQSAVDLDPGNADAKHQLESVLSATQATASALAALRRRSRPRTERNPARDGDERADGPYRHEDVTPSHIGYFDSFNDGVARGWAYEERNAEAPVELAVLIDGEAVGTARCDKQRDDIRHSLGHRTGKVGFEFEVPLTSFDGGVHTITLVYPDGSPVPVFNPGNPEDQSYELRFGQPLPDRIHGTVDGMRNGMLHGWVLRYPARSSKGSGGCTVLLTCGGTRVAQVKADRWRGDVATQMKADPNCGFQLAIPPTFRRFQPQSFRFHVMPDYVELDNSPYLTSTIDDKLESTLVEITAQVDRLHQELGALRHKLLQLTPDTRDTLDNYDGWARKYYEALPARVRASYQAKPSAQARWDRPLVSVLMPAYRPLLTDFRAAIESVIAQSYDNWELIIVDDASGDPELSVDIAAFCARDERIRSFVHDTNKNISEATNTAIRNAKGDWIAFFDHDDLLVDVALEVMVSSASRTGAEILYSDEDKIDQAGYYSEPNFKPDWDHRYLLGCNYVCHLLMVRSATLQAAGPLRTACNGAQDHDLVLRLSEIVPASRIHHVPEVLYHWRKTPNSTAVDISNKGYAVKAGVRAVGDHLSRIGKEAVVTAINDLTIYRVAWAHERQPSVCVIIPFKDQIDLTRRCLGSLVANTAWDNLEIVLVDNGSASPGAASFIAEAKALHGARVITVREEFNFSRLNNIAAAATSAEYLLLLNNDVFVEDEDWLRVMVNEALADDNVGIVGAKLLYPNGSVQHAGVVVGPLEIGSHVHRGLSRTDYGYVGRAMLTQEMTAVTAACMLVKAEAFHAVGGFDEADLKVAYNDVDLCLKIRSHGFKIIYAADCVAAHHESYSRGSDADPENEARLSRERKVMLDRWDRTDLFRADPAYNPHFVAQGQGFVELLPPAGLALHDAEEAIQDHRGEH